MALGSECDWLWPRLARRCVLLVCLQGCVEASKAGIAVNVRQPILASTNLQKANVSIRMIIRHGDPTDTLAAAACNHLQAAGGGGCSDSDHTVIQETLQKMVENFEVLSAGEQIVKQIQLGWDLLLSWRAPEEARLQFVAAAAKYPDSMFLLRELAAESMLANLLPRAGDDGYKLYWGSGGSWGHLTPPTPEDHSTLFDAWAAYATVRFQRPQSSLREQESGLLEAGLPPHGFIPSGEMQANDGNVGLLGLVFEHRLRHDIELFQLLQNMGLLSASDRASDAIQAYRSALESAPRETNGLLRPTQEQWHGMYPFYNRRLYVHPSPRSDHSLLSPASALKIELRRTPTQTASQAGGFLATGGVLVVDNILTPSALQSLRSFLELSTIWYQERGSYLGASLSTGLCSPFIAQLAGELRSLFTEVLCDLPLAHVWAFKFAEGEKGVDMHADAAAVNVNLWITPDSDNLDNSSGGLTIFDAAVDATQDNFRQYNSEEGKPYLEDNVNKSGGNSVSVPYRQNRAVVFDSARVHATQPLSFPSQTVRSRRINLTFLFGARGTYCPLRRSVHALLKDNAVHSGAADPSPGDAGTVTTKPPTAEL
ncbi:unnamed protein product [Effrenium voratum]|nr:unnamed protein product [Effrenium voratum]